MKERNQKPAVTTKRRRSRLGCGVIVFVSLIVYVLSYPWAVFSVIYATNSFEGHVWLLIDIVYAPLQWVLRYSETFSGIFDWYQITLSKIFPDYFQVPFPLEGGSTPP